MRISKVLLLVMKLLYCTTTKNYIFMFCATSLIAAGQRVLVNLVQCTFTLSGLRCVRLYPVLLHLNRSWVKRVLEDCSSFAQIVATVRNLYGWKREAIDPPCSLNHPQENFLLPLCVIAKPHSDPAHQYALLYEYFWGSTADKLQSSCYCNEGTCQPEQCGSLVFCVVTCRVSVATACQALPPWEILVSSIN